MNMGGVSYTERDIAQILNIPGVLLNRLIKKGENIHLDVLLEGNHESSPKKKKIISEVERRVIKLNKCVVSVAFVDHFRPEPSGKFRMVLQAEKIG